MRGQRNRIIPEPTPVSQTFFHLSDGPGGEGYVRDLVAQWQASGNSLFSRRQGFMVMSGSLPGSARPRDRPGNIPPDLFAFVDTLRPAPDNGGYTGHHFTPGKGSDMKPIGRVGIVAGCAVIVLSGFLCGCPSYCLPEEGLRSCPARCECACVRETLRIITDWPKAGERVTHPARS